MKNELDNAIFDKKTTLVNFSSSILAHFGVTPFHEPVPEIVEAMKGHQKIAVFLFDGLSEYNLNLYPHTTKFMREHKLMTIHSVNPATTVACTSAFLSDKFPIEDGWMGWSLWFEEKGFPIDVFTNKNSLTQEELPGPNFMKSKYDYVRIDKYLNDAGVKTKIMYRYPVEDGQGPKSFHQMDKMASKFFADGGQFLYGYWNQPDKNLHHYGVKNWRVQWTLAGINHFVKRFVKRHPDVEVFTFADHGLINVQYRDIAAYPDLADCLRLPLTLEGRTPTFFVKEGKNEEFVRLFMEHFGDQFHLFGRKEILEKGYFGEGTPSPLALSMLGDYVAVSLAGDLLVNSRDKTIDHIHKGHHAGGTKEERDVLLACYNR